MYITYLQMTLQIMPVQNCISTLKEVVKLFRMSAKAGNALKNRIMQCCPSAKQTRLLKFCETRWVEHLNSLSLFHELYKHICFAFEELTNKNIATDGFKPQVLLNAITQSPFIVALTIIKSIFALTKNISVQLQCKDCDLRRCIDYTEALYEEIKDMRQNAEAKFKVIFELAQEEANKVGFILDVPRRVGRQTQRENYEGNAETYFRCSIFIPILDHYLDQINLKFIKNKTLLKNIQNILAKKIVECDNLVEIAENCETYWRFDLETSIDDFTAELTIWRRFWAGVQKEKLPENFIDTLNQCDKTLYPTIHKFLIIGATLPVSVASNERSFSSLRRLQTYLRSTMGQDRLVGLTLLNVHREIEVTEEEILDELAKKSRRMPFKI